MHRIYLITLQITLIIFVLTNVFVPCKGPGNNEEPGPSEINEPVIDPFQHNGKPLTFKKVNKDYFKTFNKVYDNRVTVNDLVDYFKKRYNVPPEEIPEITDVINSFDTQNKNALNEVQYMELMKHMRFRDYEKEDLENFDAFDMNGDNFIDASELFAVLNSMKKPILYSTAVEMIKKADQNNKNMINREEFKNLFKGYKMN